jgi:O-antigen/teichoic acid export membrane protein
VTATAGGRVSVVGSAAWAGAEAATLAVVSFATLVAMAWLLGPTEFGIAATALIVVQLLLVLVGAGLVNGPLIQRNDLSQAHVDTVFWTSFGAAVLLVAACWLGAAELASRLDQPRLAPILAVFALMLLPTAYEAVQVALLRREFGFRRIAIRTFVSRIAGSAVGLGVALMDGGAWSIVAQHLATVVVSVAMLRAWAPRRIGLQFRFAALRDVMGFSAPALLTEIMSAGGPRLLQFVAAFLLGPQAFAFLHLGLRVVDTLRELVIDLANNLAFSMFARVQEDRALLARHFLASTSTLCSLAMPAFLGLGAFATMLVPTLMGTAWAEAVPVVHVLAFTAAVGFVAAFCVPVLWAIGRPALGLAPRAIELLAALGLLFVLAPGGPALAAIAWGARQVIELGFALIICPRVLPIRAVALLRAVVLPTVLAVAVVLVLLLVDHALPAGFGPLARIGIIAVLGAMLTVCVAGIVQPTLARAALARVRPRASLCERR